MTNEIIDKVKDTKITYKFYQKNILAIFKVLTMLRKRYFFVIMINIIKKNVASNNIPIPKANIDFCGTYCDCFYGLKNGKVCPKYI